MNNFDHPEGTKQIGEFVERDGKLYWVDFKDTPEIKNVVAPKKAVVRLLPKEVVYKKETLVDGDGGGSYKDTEVRIPVGLVLGMVIGAIALFFFPVAGLVIMGVTVLFRRVL